MFPEKFSSLFIFFVLGALGLFAYGQTLSYPFVHDDVVFIQQNPQITRLDWGQIFHGAAPGQPSQVINVYYRPLLEVLYRIEYFFFGPNPAGYHLFNILVHAVNGFLVYILIALLDGKRKGPAFAAAILFLLHPVQSEAVACISGISNLLFSLWVLASLCLYLRWRQGGGQGWHVLSLFTFLFGLLTKEQAVVVPVLILGLESMGTVPGKFGWKKLAARSAFYWFVLAGYFLVRKIFIAPGALPTIALNYELLLRVSAIPRTVLMYFGIIVFPRDLHYYRSIDILEPNAVSWALLLLVIVVISAIIRRSPAPEKRLLSLGAGWFGITLLPVMNIVPLVNEYSLILTAEHFLYLPLAGALLFLLGCGCLLLNRMQISRPMIAATGSICLLALFSAAATIRQNTSWAGEVPLFERTVRFEKNFGRAHILLANAYYAEGDYARAVETYRRALTIMDGYLVKVGPQPVAAVYLGFIKEIHLGLARCFEAAGDLPKASESYLRALVIDPADAGVHNNLAIVYGRLGDPEKAEAHFREAMQIQGK